MGSTVHRKRVLAKARASYKKAKAARAKKVKVEESKPTKKPTVKKVVKKVVKKDKPVKEAPIGIRRPAKNRTNTTEGRAGIARPSQGQPNKKPLFDMTGANIKDTTKGNNEATKKLNIRSKYGGGGSTTSKKADENKKRGYEKGRKRSTTTKKASEKNKRGYSRARTR